MSYGDCVDVMCCGRLFQIRAAATGKARLCRIYVLQMASWQ